MLLQMVKFGFAGLTATAVHTAMLLFLVEKMGMGAVLASIPAFLTATLVSFLVNHHWTFIAPGGYRLYLPRYAAVSITGLFLNIAIMYSVVSLLHQPYGIGLAVVIILVPVISFFLQRHWTFSDATHNKL
jgi:putative flippase GtrA